MPLLISSRRSIGNRRALRTRQRGFARLPWWVWAVLAGLTFFLLGGLAQTLEPTMTQGADAASASTSAKVLSVLHTLAQVTQYLLPLVMIIVAGARFGARNDNAASAASARVKRSGNGHSEPKNRMHWGQFELLTLEVFRRRGYRMSERGTPSSDGSMNLEVHKDGKKYVVHCKQWRAKEVAMGAVRELNSMMIVANAAGGFVVTSGTFSKEVRAFVAGRNIQLIDGATMREMLRDPETAAAFEASIMPTGVATVSPTLPR
jgi:restriction system protein